MVQIKKKTANMWEYKFANVGNFVCLENHD